MLSQNKLIFGVREKLNYAFPEEERTVGVRSLKPQRLKSPMQEKSEVKKKRMRPRKLIAQEQHSCMICLEAFKDLEKQAEETKSDELELCSMLPCHHRFCFGCAD